MKNNLFYFFILIFQFHFSNAQLNNSDTDKLSKLLTKKVNELRANLDKVPLKNNEDLAKAAKLHSIYTAKKGKLNHTQTGTNFPKPKDRVANYNKTFDIVGENILYSKPVRLPLSGSAINKLALEMFRSWKNSPGHYANMIFDDFTYSGFGFEYSPKSKRIFATHIFGKKGYVVPKQLSGNAFSIKEADKSCVELVGNKSNVIVNMGNSITIEDDEIFIKHHSLKTIKETIDKPSDGLAIDLVERDQLSCFKDNTLDISPIYEGVMLKPVFHNQLFSKNLSKNKKRLIASLGKVPEHLKGKSVSPNIILIKEGKKCGYAAPSYIPSRKYDLKFVDPIVFEPEIQLKTEGVMGVNMVEFNFDADKTNPTSIPTIPFQVEKLHSVDIKSYTSVDGNEEYNDKLHKARAIYIEKFVRQNVNNENLPIHVYAKENWDLCYYQLEITGLDEILSNDKTEIRNHIKKERNGNWKRFLEQQRQSKAIFYQYGDWLESSTLHLNYNLVDALLTSNYDLANKALAKMYKNDNSNLFLYEEFIVDYLFDKEELVQNVAALLLKNIDYYDLDNVVYFVRNWLSKPETLSKSAQKNLLNLYNMTSRKLLRHWDSSLDDFSKVLHPKKVEPLFNNYKSKDQVNPIFLNFHMTSIDYYGQINYNKKIEESFDFITDYFRKKALTIEDDIALSLFFNRWSSYHLTTELLGRRFKNKTLNEDASFILAKTYVANNEDMSSLIGIHKKALKFNKQRWCEWIDRDFQNLQNESVKNLYCKTCKN